MILSVSRRTDIPAYYMPWFLRRLKEGFVYVRNPLNPHQISKITLSPEVVDAIVFWTKNPVALLEGREELKEYPVYLQCTVTGYGNDIEPGLPSKRKVILPAIKELGKRIGSENIALRYDPIFVNDHYRMDYHKKALKEILDILEGSVGKVVISFVDLYRKTVRNMKGIAVKELTEEELTGFAKELAQIARSHGLSIETCAEAIDLGRCGIRHGSCIDKREMERLTGMALKGKKDQGQRQECGCMESIDIGAYHSCLTGCKYCYANSSIVKAKKNHGMHKIDSPLLYGEVTKEDRISERKAESLKDGQITLF